MKTQSGFCTIKGNRDDPTISLHHNDLKWKHLTVSQLITAQITFEASTDCSVNDPVSQQLKEQE